MPEANLFRIFTDRLNKIGVIKSYVLLTIDVEDWFQVQNLKACIPSSTWSSCESRVERNTHRLLDLLDSSGCGGAGKSLTFQTLRATFFILGWIAERKPNLVREIHRRGHEVASHGFSHQLCGDQSYRDLKREVGDSKKLLEDLTGAPVVGFRAPNFSVTRDLLDTLEECGYSYDSSFNSFAINRRYGKLELSDNARKGIAYKLSEQLYEIPISNLQFGKYVVPMGGGGYFRMMPFALFRRGVRLSLKQKGAYVFYIHPWEIDPDQPRVRKARPHLKFCHYLNLAGTLGKLSALLRTCSDSQFVTCTQYLQR